MAGNTDQMTACQLLNTALLQGVSHSHYTLPTQNKHNSM